MKRWDNIRRAAWDRVLELSRHPEGLLMPRWLRVIRFALFPVDSLYWMLSESRGYQFERDVWKIEGVTWSGRALRQLAQAQGHEFKVCRIDDVVYLVRLK